MWLFAFERGGIGVAIRIETGVGVPWPGLSADDVPVELLLNPFYLHDEPAER